MTSTGHFPISNIHDFTTTLHGTTILSKIELVHVYHQIPVDPDGTRKTAATTPFSLFEFLWISFGLRNAAQTFHRFIDQVLWGLHFCSVYTEPFVDSLFGCWLHHWFGARLFR